MFTLFKQLKSSFRNWCLNASDISIGELFSETESALCSIYNNNVLKFVERGAPDDLFVNTPSGFAPVKHIFKTVPYDVWCVKLNNGSEIYCADEHLLIDCTGAEVFTKDLALGDELVTINGIATVISVTKIDCPPESMYDLELADENHVYYTNDILSHNSETSCAYLFWFSIFNKDKTVLITSNKHKNSSEMISRIKYMYESLPDFLKPGVTDDGWNKLSLKFETGSRIISDATSETTGRGGSFSILYCLGGDTTVTVRESDVGDALTISLHDLYHATGINASEGFNANTTHQVLTPHGWVGFSGILKTLDKQLFRISLSDGTHVDATAEHAFFTSGERKQTRDLRAWECIDTTTTQLIVTDVQPIDTAAVYDLVEVKNGDHSFLVNGNIITKNCDETAFVRPMIQTEFWASISPTLATGGKLFMTSTPNGDSDLFATLWRGAVAGINGMKPLTIKWNKVPGRTEAFKKQEIAKNGELKWRQEFACCESDETVTVQDESGKIHTISLETLFNILTESSV